MVLLIDFLFIAFWLVLAYFMITQILLPSLRGRKLFPWFRKRLREADRVLTEVREEEYEESELGKARREQQRRNAAAANVIIDVTTRR